MRWSHSASTSACTRTNASTRNGTSRDRARFATQRRTHMTRGGNNGSSQNLPTGGNFFARLCEKLIQRAAWADHHNTHPKVQRPLHTGLRCSWWLKANSLSHIRAFLNVLAEIDRRTSEHARAPGRTAHTTTGNRKHGTHHAARTRNRTHALSLLWPQHHVMVSMGGGMLVMGSRRVSPSQSEQHMGRETSKNKMRPVAAASIRHTCLAHNIRIAAKIPPIDMG